jgi:hypothetical protein
MAVTTRKQFDTIRTSLHAYIGNCTINEVRERASEQIARIIEVGWFVPIGQYVATKNLEILCSRIYRSEKNFSVL